jgi:hypothetical protein
LSDSPWVLMPSRTRRPKNPILASPT